MNTQATDLHAKKILVVDDNPVILKTLSSALGSQGYEVITAADTSEAIAAVRKEKPDLILLDIFFPPTEGRLGMVWDGFHVIEWLRRMGVARDIPIIVISAADSAKYKDQSLAAGAVAFFQKPLDKDELLAAIRKALDKKDNQQSTQG